MFNKMMIWCGVILMLTVLACNRQSQEASEQNTQTPQTATAPQPAAPAAPPVKAVKTGSVAETMNAGGYTYLLVDDGTEQTWIAVLKSDVAVGEEVSYYDGMVMQNFESKTLGRTFERIVFSNGLVGKTETAEPIAAAVEQAGDSFADALNQEGSKAASEMTAGSKKAVVPFTEIQLDKATGENSYTVGELYEKAAELDGKTIAVKGKVVKISANIMGLNWIHIQDGTGNPTDSSHDLVITTATAPQEEWDIITVNGVLSANKDFGAGYLYPVIIEEAEISE